MINNKHLIVGTVSIVILTLFNCSSGGGDNPGTPDPILPPEAAILTSPEKDEECNQGNIVSATQSTVRFQWNASGNTDSYTLILKNLDTDVTSEQSTNTTTASVTIERNTPYSWQVISKSKKTTTTASSETWKFYNAGEGVTNYAPFPADLVAPTMGSEVPNPVTLSWSGSDIDGDITSYDVYLGTANPPTNLQGNTTGTSISDLNLNASTVYYWRVVTKDESNNNSQSEVFEFRVE